MPKAFIIITDNATREDQDAIRTLLTEAVSWWHQTPQAWLVTDPSNTMTTSSLREAIRGVCPSLTFLVLVARPGPSDAYWTGYAPPEWYDWMYKNWLA